MSLRPPRGVMTAPERLGSLYAALDRRVKQLERIARREWTWRGAWSAQTYRFGDTVRISDETLVCTNEEGCPNQPTAGGDADWDLVSGGGGGGGVPIGAMIAGPWTASAPDYEYVVDGVTWLQVRAQTITGGATTYPDLATAYPGWVSGADLILPSSSAHVLYFNHGGTPGADAGFTNTKTITEANLPAHAHTQTAHTHSGPSHDHDLNLPAKTSTNAGGHTHRGRWLGNLNNSGGNDYLRRWVNSGTIDSGVVEAVSDHAHNVNPDNATTTAGGTGQTGDGSSNGSTDPTGLTGSGTAFDVRQAGLVQRLWVRAA